MTAPNVIWAWPWEVNPSMGQWETKQSIVGEGIRYIRADAPELLALVEAAKSALRFIENTESELGVVLGCGDKTRTAIAAWEAIAPKPATDAMTPWGIQPDGSGLDPATLPIHRGGKASDDA